MKSEELKRHILGFMYAERLKSALIITGQLLDVLSDLTEKERAGGLKMFGSFVRGVGSEMRLAANVMTGAEWDGLSGYLNLMEGYARPARIFHELVSRDRGEECATGQPQGIGSEAYLNSTSQGLIPEDARKDGHICGRSRQFMKYPG